MSAVIHTEASGLIVSALPITERDDKNRPTDHTYLAYAGAAGLGELQFQHGTIPEAGVNGWTNEALIAVLVHRLQCLNGQFPCRENSLAITKLEEAGHWLEARTRNRQARGVEGKHAA